MKNFFTLTLCFLTLSITAQEPLTYPYNPDANSDQFVAVSDVLETIATYGDQFFPEEIMVGDTTLSNWIQILNQTLSNQQAVIDSLQASLDSQDTQLDSIMIADMIAAAGGLGGGGGCDLQFPDGYKNMEVVHIDLTSESYTVPDGKNLYITHANSFGGSSQIYLNNSLLILRYTDSDKGRMPTIISANNTISLNNFEGNLSTISGFLVDAVVESQHISLVDNSFTVPSGKRLYLRSYICDNTSALLEINGTQIFQYANNSFIDNSSSPLVVASGEVISATYPSSPLNSTINGYLVDEDYFADCGGGGGSSDGVSVFMAGLISGSDTVFVPESADVVYLEISGGNGHLALPLDNSYKKIEIIQEGTTGGNLDILGNSSGNYLSTASNDWQGIAIAIRNSEGFWRVIEN